MVWRLLTSVRKRKCSVSMIMRLMRGITLRLIESTLLILILLRFGSRTRTQIRRLLYWERWIAMGEYVPIPMSDKEISEAVSGLNAYFGTKATWRRKTVEEEGKSKYRDYEGRGAYTNMELRRIVMGAKVDIMVVLHEFAHILGTTYPNWHMETILGFVSSHGRRFREDLVKVATYQFGDVSKYEWGDEYPSIVKWAHERGYTPYTLPRIFRSPTAEAVRHLETCPVCRGDDDSE